MLEVSCTMLQVIQLHGLHQIACIMTERRLLVLGSLCLTYVVCFELGCMCYLAVLGCH